jgi:hypothetical protein
MTREELAAMTDDEILAHYRNKHGDPYMPLSMAKKMHHATFKWWHLDAAAEARRKGIPLPWDDPVWQEEIRQAKQRVAEYEGSQGTQ